MDNTSREDVVRREPVRTPWVWVAMVAIVLAGVPFYLPTGTIEPLFGGLPLWLWISIAATVCFSAVTSVACWTTWNLVQPEEDAAEAAGRPISSVHTSSEERPA